MTCFHPIDVHRALGDAGGPIRFGKSPIGAYRNFKVPCGQCTGCRLERSRQWAVRMMHEAKSHADNCFITLTYSDDFLPTGKTLVLKDFQDFMKRLRKQYGSGIRFFHCGEYGETLGRPHYHACLFGMDFSDKVKIGVNENGDERFRSAKLEALWPLGLSECGSLTFQSAAYVARYCMKKVTGDAADFHYAYLDGDTWRWRLPEYATMSRRSGIGSDFIGKYMGDVYPNDFVVVNGFEARPPRFYDSAYELHDPEGFAKLKVSRIRNAKKHSDNNTPDRLQVREQVLAAKLKMLKREME